MMNMLGQFRHWVVVAAAIFVTSVAARAADVRPAEFTVEKTDDGVVVKLNGELFTKYLTLSGKKPILWPIIGPTGKPMTRAWPMDTAEVDAAIAAKGGEKLAKTDVITND